MLRSYQRNWTRIYQTHQSEKRVSLPHWDPIKWWSPNTTAMCPPHQPIIWYLDDHRTLTLAWSPGVAMTSSAACLFTQWFGCLSGPGPSPAFLTLSVSFHLTAGLFSNPDCSGHSGCSLPALAWIVSSPLLKPFESCHDPFNLYIL